MIEYFDELCELYEEKWLLEVCSYPQPHGLSIIHLMVATGNYRFVKQVAVAKLGYQVDYFHPHTRMTLLHTIAKYRTNKWDEEEV